MKKAFLFIIALLFKTYAFAQNDVNFIDLDLPSGTLWADRNVGATSPEDYGNYYAWGETETKKKYNWSNYKFKGTLLYELQGEKFGSLTKYISASFNGYKPIFSDNKIELEKEDDVVSKTYGDKYRIPTSKEAMELHECCTWIKTDGGFQVVGKNANSIFIPFGGKIKDKKHIDQGIAFSLWTSTSIDGESAYIIYNNAAKDSWFRYYACNVRAVKYSNQTPAPVIYGSIPILTFDSPLETMQPSYKLRVKVNSSSAITASKVFVNGQLSRGVSPVKNDGAQFVIEKTVTVAEGINTIRVEVSNSSGTKSEDYNVKYVKKTQQKPVLTWNSLLITESKDYQLQIGVISNSTITDTKVFVNGEQSRGVNTVKNDGYNFMLSKSLLLPEGNNVIRAEVTNSDGTAIIEKNVTFKKAKVVPVQSVVVVPDQPVAKVQKRQALVIGNSNYKNVNFSKLKNPANDAKAIAAKLRTLGFDVIEKEDLTLLEYGRAIDEFTRKSGSYDVSLFYYSGHAVEMDGINYLAPIDAVGEQPFDLKRECINANELLGGLEKAESPANIIVLDACRNNPNIKTRGYGMSGGLAQMLAPTGTFIMYSTAPGKTANDGTGQYSPFTDAFLSCLDKKELVLEMFAKEVSSIVKNKTNKMQAPWNSGSIDGYFYFHQK